ncbi:hypothetical protein [Telluria antibiotica]|uniref:hypothetical protein n=1 Tax=Telluria antibiotica TaxID=2717319 RepID=UPI001E5690B6|nr:hypothetical protein [Telluria antibiotica]
MVISPLAAQHQFDACWGSFGTSIVDTSGGLQQADNVPKAKSPQIICALFIAATSSESIMYVENHPVPGRHGIGPPATGIGGTMANPTLFR